MFSRLYVIKRQDTGETLLTVGEDSILPFPIKGDCLIIRDKYYTVTERYIGFEKHCSIIWVKDHHGNEP